MELARSTFLVFALLGALTFWYVDNSHSPAPAQSATVADSSSLSQTDAVQ